MDIARCCNSMVRFRFAMISFNLTFYNGNISSNININQQNFKPGNYMAKINIFLIQSAFPLNTLVIKTVASSWNAETKVFPII